MQVACKLVYVMNIKAGAGWQLVHSKMKRGRRSTSCNVCVQLLLIATPAHRGWLGVDFGMAHTEFYTGVHSVRILFV